ncbi:MAG: nucleotide pyrophosphatase [Ferruginibacter sp.]|nr:nucleotide pyrophosphatase [Ferruginibacter sp.]
MRIKYYMLQALLLFSFSPLMAQPGKAASPAKPKLVVGLVIDQMRWDYLYRFQSLYGTGGFNRLLKQGFSCENTFIPYVPTYTAVGHSTVYTGSVPAYHGIVGNYWFDKSINGSMYCTSDSTVTGLGNNGWAGKMSPKNLWVSTITDELRLSTNFESKVIGIALKDRGAILPAGHSANAAYWYDEGKWISSSFYMKALPAWVNDFNAKDLAGKYMSQDWNTLLPLEKYSQSTADDQPYELALPGETSPTFPHRLSTNGKTKYEAFKYTPFAASFTFDFARQAMEEENLGKGKATDFLAVSISSTDYTGHSFGPNSIEVEDSYLRLDKDVADFLTYLDKNLGKDNYLVFLTADHGATHVPGFLAEHRIPGGVYSNAALTTEINNSINDLFGFKKAVLSVQNYQVYLDLAGMEKNKIDIEAMKKQVIKILSAKPFITTVYETAKTGEATLPQPYKERAINGYTASRSGDIQFVLKSGYFDGGLKGTTHGLWNPYDAHIPLLWYGWGVKQGQTNRETYMTDISATLAGMLKIQMPSGCVGHVVTELIK